MSGVPTLRTGEPALVQLEYATGRIDDAWRMMVCCIMLNLTTRKQLDDVRDELFSRWPSANAMAEADFGELCSVISPCGLAVTRADRLKRFSWDWAAFEIVRHEAPDYRLPTAAEVRAMPGIGQYAEDSYRIFVLGEWATTPATDKELVRWLKWKVAVESTP